MFTLHHGLGLPSGFLGQVGFWVGFWVGSDTLEPNPANNPTQWVNPVGHTGLFLYGSLYGSQLKL